MKKPLYAVAAMTIAAALFATGPASALEPIGGLNNAVITTPQESINEAVLSDPTIKPHPAINEAVLGNSGFGSSGRTNNGFQFACVVDNADLLVTNVGEAVPAGTKVRWRVSEVGMSGAFLLNHGMLAGQKVRVDIAATLDAGTPCAANAA